MADDPREAAEITEMCDGLVINIGTLSERVVPSMLSSGRQAERLSENIGFRSGRSRRVPIQKKNSR